MECRLRVTEAVGLWHIRVQQSTAAAKPYQRSNGQCDFGVKPEDAARCRFAERIRKVHKNQ
jgi:hypothetical protein